MSATPDFFDLVGDEGTPEELAQLAARARPAARGRPAARALAASRRSSGGRSQPRALGCARRRHGAAFLLAAAIAAAAFGVGYLVGDRGSSDFQPRGTPIEMHPPAASSPAPPARRS